MNLVTQRLDQGCVSGASTSARHEEPMIEQARSSPSAISAADSIEYLKGWGAMSCSWPSGQGEMSRIKRALSAARLGVR